MIDKDKTRVDMSLGDYEKLQEQLKEYKELFEKLTSSEYVEYEIDYDYNTKPWVKGKKYCELKFNAKKFIENNFNHFQRHTDKLLKKMSLEKVKITIEN